MDVDVDAMNVFLGISDLELSFLRRNNMFQRELNFSRRIGLAT